MRGGQVKFNPYKSVAGGGGGGRKALVMLRGGGHKSFEVALK